MIHLRSLLSLGAVSDRSDEFQSNYTSKSSRLSNTNKNRFNKYLNTNVLQTLQLSTCSSSPQLSYDIDSTLNNDRRSVSPFINIGNPCRRLSSSVSTKLSGHKSKRQFSYKSKPKTIQKSNINTNVLNKQSSNILTSIVESPALTSIKLHTISKNASSLILIHPSIQSIHSLSNILPSPTHIVDIHTNEIQILNKSLPAPSIPQMPALPMLPLSNRKTTDTDTSFSEEYGMLPYSSYSSPNSLFKSNSHSETHAKHPPLQRELPAPVKPHASNPMFNALDAQRTAFLPPPVRPRISSDELPNGMPQLLPIEAESKSNTHSSSSKVMQRLKSTNSWVSGYSDTSFSMSPYSPRALMMMRCPTNDSNWSDSKKSDQEPMPELMDKTFMQMQPIPTVTISLPLTIDNCVQEFEAQLQAGIKMSEYQIEEEKETKTENIHSINEIVEESPMPYKMFDDYNYDEDIAHNVMLSSTTLSEDMPAYIPKLGTIRSTSSFVATAIPSFVKIDEINNFLSPFSDLSTVKSSRYSTISYPSTRTSGVTNLSSYTSSSVSPRECLGTESISSCSSTRDSCRSRQIRYRLTIDSKNEPSHSSFPETSTVYSDTPFIKNLAPLIMTPTTEYVSTPIIIESMSPEYKTYNEYYNNEDMHGIENFENMHGIANFENMHSLSMNEFNIGLGFSTSEIQESEELFSLVSDEQSQHLSLNFDFITSKTISSTIYDDSMDTPSTVYISSNTTPKLNEFDEEYMKQMYQPFAEDMYEFMNNLGRGAFGIVQKLFHLQSCKVVAVKRSICMEEIFVRQFKNEVRICTEFADCEQIMSIIDYGCDSENHICIALEYMDIGSLENIAHYNTNEIKHIAKQVLIALQTLHNKLYIHNDIKPDNILINSNGDVKLSDYGCVQQMSSIDHSFAIPIGPLKYQSYEKKMVSPIKYGIASDVYSFGITVAELFESKHVKHKSIVDNERNESFLIEYKGPKLSHERFSNDSEFHIANDFLQCCLEKDQNKRLTAEQLLKHPFLADINDDICFETSFDIGVEHRKSSDLQFMIDRLSMYYLGYIERQNIETDVRLSPYPKQSDLIIDQLYTDEERIRNIAIHCNYSINEVSNAIQSAVARIKDKYLQQ